MYKRQAGSLDAAGAASLLIECVNKPTFGAALAAVSPMVRSEAANLFIRASFDEGRAAWNPAAVDAAIAALLDADANEVVAVAIDVLNGGALSAERAAHSLASLAKRQPPARPDQAHLAARVNALLDAVKPPSEGLARELGAASSWVDHQLFQDQLKALRRTKGDPARLAASSFEAGRKH